MEKRYAAVDLAKYIAALMIVAIHTSLFSEINETLSFAVVQILCRLAVPFFAMCTGCFLCKQTQAGGKQAFLRQWKKLVILYGVWTVLYMFYSIPMWIEIDWFSPFAFVDYAVGAVTKGAHYHLWYLWGLIYTLPVFCLILYKIPKKVLPWITVVLWLVKTITYGYSSFLPQTKLLQILQGAGSFLCLLPLLLAGAVMAESKSRTTKVYLVGFGISLACLFAEAFVLKSHGQSAVSYILFTLPTGYFLLQLILRADVRIPDAVCRNLGKISMLVYCVHPMFVEITEDVFASSILHFCFAAMGSTAVGLLYLLIRKRLDRKKGKLCFN